LPLSSLAPVKWALGVMLLVLSLPAAAAVQRHAPLYDSVKLNIGLNCRWEQKCIAQQTRAMNKALAYVRAHHPAQARIHLCNRNASRSRSRVDWVGFNNCIRNSSLRSARRR
jgi:hypothetical protein